MTTRRLVRRLLMFGLYFGVLTLGLGRPADAQTFSVTNLGDNGTGSLRQAIADANAVGGGTIQFDLTDCHCTIELTSGELVIEKNLTIKGPGPTLLTVSGKLASRVFRIAAGVTAEIEGLQVSDGNGTGGGTYPSFGGGIFNEGALRLSNVVVANSRGGLGGGIYTTGELSISRSTFRNNTAAHGGGIHADGPLTVRESTVARNSVEGGTGGGIFLGPESVATIVGSSISNNSATYPGGGLLVSGTVTLVNSTISGNEASFGGGVEVLSFGKSGGLTLVSTTVTGNTATGGGGGIRSLNFDKPVVLNNTIVAGNLPDDVPEPAISNNSLIGGNAADVLFPLADNGGPTQTHKLVANSPAIGAGDNTLLPADTLDLDDDGNTDEPVPVDQRGVGFPRIYGLNVDIGAVEVVCTAIVLTRTPPPAPPSVGVPYSETIVASGGASPYSFAATGLPGGLTLSPTTGVLSGTPTASGTFTVAVTVTDASGCVGTLTFTLTIADPSCGIVIGPATLKTPYLATLYYQPLSVTPSGQYAVTVSAGALPHGVYLFAIGRNWFLGGIPSAPGTYTFTLAAKKTNSPCAPTRTYTVIVPATVLPQLTCVAKTGAKQYTAHFGYDNSTDGAVGIPVGANNYFTPGAQDRGQVTTFQKGRVTNAFSVVFTVKNNTTDLALWYLRGPDNVRRPVNITTATSRCP